MNRIEVQRKFDEIKQLEKNNLTRKIEIMKEIISSGYFKTENYLSQFEDNENKKSNELLRFLKYKDGYGYYKGIDCDVCLTSMVTYCMMYDFLSENNIQLQFKEQYKYEIKNGENIVYRGDTITSAWTAFKNYLTFLWFKKGISPLYRELFIEYVNKKGIPIKGTITIPNDKDKPSYKSLIDYVIDRGTNDEEFCKIIYSTISGDAKNFLNNYMTAGNYLCIPGNTYSGVSFNTARSNGGKWDTVDLFLWKIYQYYHTGDKKYIEMIFTSNQTQLAQDFMRWVHDFGITCWNEFITIHCLQDFVESCGDGKYGKPISLKTGNPIEEINGGYDPIPKNLEECETFFKTASKRIPLRTQRIFKKITGQK